MLNRYLRLTIRIFWCSKHCRSEKEYGKPLHFPSTLYTLSHCGTQLSTDEFEGGISNFIASSRQIKRLLTANQKYKTWDINRNFFNSPHSQYFRLGKWMPRVSGQRTCPLYIVFAVGSDVSIPRAPVTVAISSFISPLNPLNSWWVLI